MSSTRPSRRYRRAQLYRAVDDHFWLLVAVLVTLRLVSLVALLASGQENLGSILGGDARRYHQIAFAQGTPYQDFAVEYPPVSLGVIWLVDDANALVMLIKLAVSQFALDLGVAALLLWGWGRRTAIGYLVLGTPFLLYPFTYLRVDLVSVVLATLGVALVRRHREIPGGIAAAAAVLAKAWPFALGGLFWVERKGRAGAAWVISGAVMAAAWILWAGPVGPIEVFSFRGATGWQLESWPGIVIHTLDPARAKVESGAWRTGSMGAWTRPVLTGLSLGGVVVAWVLARRRRVEGTNDAVSYGLAPLAAITSMLVFAPIISPQYMLWLLPWAAILVGRGDRLVGLLVLGINLASTFGMLWIKLQTNGLLLGLVPIWIRNTLLVALLGVVFAQLAGYLRSPALEPGGPPGAITGDYASNEMEKMRQTAPTRSSDEVINGTP